MQVVLYQPEIPPNTGNIIRLCANTGVALHLIHPLGFNPTDKQVKRAGLDYHEWTKVFHHQDYPSFIENVKPKRLFACSTHGKKSYHEVSYSPEDVFIFGPETRGLPKEMLREFPEDQVIKIPMLPHSRSLNLSNAVAVIIYEAWRQQGYQYVV